MIGVFNIAFKNLQNISGIPVKLRILICFIAGLLSALATPPVSLIWVLFFTLPAVFLILASFEKKHALSFLSGFFFGFAYFLISLIWIGNALLVEGNDYAWAWPLAVTGLPLILSLFWATGFYIWSKLFTGKTLSGLLGFMTIFYFAEWLRGHLFTGFPWNLFGYGWSEYLEILQITSIGGIYFLTYLTIFWACSPAILFMQNISKRKSALFLTIAGVSFLVIYAYGFLRLSGSPAETYEGIEIVIVQPNIPQHEKWDRALLHSNFKKHLDLSVNQNQKATGTTFIIWPETAIHPAFLGSENARLAIQNMLASYQGDAMLIAGALRYEKTPEKELYYNSIVFINKDGAIEHVYDKHHLVPFGEYIPFQQYIPLKTVTGFQGFVAGPGHQPIQVQDKAVILPLICYESIFPFQKKRSDDVIPSFIVNVTNDAWYGQSAGPHQHLQQSRIRAIELGLPFLRSSNTGISAFIDPYGRILRKKELAEKGILKAFLPKEKKHIVFQEFRVIFENLFPALIFLFSILVHRRSKNHLIIS